jgi:hypothetical protein
MTNQELFSRVRNHLLTQQHKSLDAFGDCMYRGPDGLQCAIGCLIPDEKYDRDFEQRRVTNTTIREAAGITSDQTDLAISLQNVHDGYSVDEWPDALQKVAVNYGLENV